MRIKIYQTEIEDGLADKIAANNSVACCGIPSFSFDKKFAVAQNDNQPDLYYMKSILVSTVWNKNDEIFTPEDTWLARNTAEDKPLNVHHKALDIIGHHTANVCVNDDMEVIPDDTPVDALPEKFHILLNSVIYTQLDDLDKKKEVQKIVEEINQGHWFVSMEAYFTDFDYALKTENSYKIVKRTKSTAFLTKFLRMYGGSGVYKNNEESFRVGRVLRNIYFAGAGLVKDPANPESIIFRSMSEMTVEELQVKLDEMTGKYKGSVQMLAASKAEVQSLKDKNVELANKLSFNDRVEKVKAALNSDKDKAEKLVKLYEREAEENFDKLLATLKEMFGETKPAKSDASALENPIEIPGFDGNIEHVSADVQNQIYADIKNYAFGENE